MTSIILRTRLQEIIEHGVVNSHKTLIENARQDTPHTIEVLTTPTDNLGYNYNCVMFALGIESDREYFNMVLNCPEDIHASTQFIQFLVNHGYLIECKSQEPRTLVAYINEDGQFRHIGIITEKDRVRSKWGIGHLYEHATFETPVSYGNNIRFFEPMERNDVLNAFHEFAQLNDVSLALGT